jgi:hypothetical protein
MCGWEEFACKTFSTSIARISTTIANENGINICIKSSNVKFIGDSKKIISKISIGECKNELGNEDLLEKKIKIEENSGSTNTGLLTIGDNVNDIIGTLMMKYLYIEIPSTLTSPNIICISKGSITFILCKIKNIDSSLTTPLNYSILEILSSDSSINSNSDLEIENISFSDYCYLLTISSSGPSISFSSLKYTGKPNLEMKKSIKDIILLRSNSEPSSTFTLTGGLFEDVEISDGSLIYIDIYAGAILTEVTFKNIISYIHIGGTINAVVGVNLEITSCLFENCITKTKESETNIICKGGAIYCELKNGGRFTVRGLENGECEFKNCGTLSFEDVKNGYGGAIYLKLESKSELSFIFDGRVAKGESYINDIGYLNFINNKALHGTDIYIEADKLNTTFINNNTFSYKYYPFDKNSERLWGNENGDVSMETLEPYLVTLRDDIYVGTGGHDDSSCGLIIVERCESIEGGVTRFGSGNTKYIYIFESVLLSTVNIFQDTSEKLYIITKTIDCECVTYINVSGDGEIRNTGANKLRISYIEILILNQLSTCIVSISSGEVEMMNIIFKLNTNHIINYTLFSLIGMGTFNINNFLITEHTNIYESSCVLIKNNNIDLILESIHIDKVTSSESILHINSGTLTIIESNFTV